MPGPAEIRDIARSTHTRSRSREALKTHCARCTCNKHHAERPQRSWPVSKRVYNRLKAMAEPSLLTMSLKPRQTPWPQKIVNAPGVSLLCRKFAATLFLIESVSVTSEGRQPSQDWEGGTWAASASRSETTLLDICMNEVASALIDNRIPGRPG